MLFNDRGIQLQLQQSSHGSMLVALDRLISAESPDTSQAFQTAAKGNILKVPLESSLFDRSLIPPDSEVVDVLHRNSFRIRGCDLNTNPNNHDRPIDKGNVTCLPYNTGTFNLVLCINFVCEGYFEFASKQGLMGSAKVTSFEDFHARATQEYLRVLKAGGLLLIAALSSCQEIIKALDPKSFKIRYQDGGQERHEAHHLLIEKD